MTRLPPATPEDATPSGVSARAGELRLELQRTLGDAQDRRFHSFLRRVSLSSLVPGLGLVLAGRRRAGSLVLLVVVGLVGGAVVLYRGLTRSELVGLAVDPGFLRLAAAGMVCLAVLQVLSSVASHRLLRPPGMRTSQRMVGGIVTTLVTAIVVAPLAVASRYAYVQYSLVTDVFTATEDGGSDGSSTGEAAAPAPDPWEGVERVTILLLGSDAGPGREGTRPDTNIVASVDTSSGDMVLFSLPRNLEGVPFPARSDLADSYPDGWQGVSGDDGSQLLNAIYRYVPAAHPDLFDDVDDPGAAAMKLAAEGVLGLPVDYYVMVDLDGFQQVVDALGGVELNVRQRIPLESSLLPSGICSTPTGYLEPGMQRLNGYQALWYARVRCGGEGLTDDYGRMRRQRCVIGAMIDRADPLTLLARYERLANTTKRIMSTDIPESMAPALAELALRVQGATVRTLPFTDRVIHPGAPDYHGIRAQVSDALRPPEPRNGSDTKASTPGSTIDKSDGVQALDDVC